MTLVLARKKGVGKGGEDQLGVSSQLCRRQRGYGSVRSSCLEAHTNSSIQYKAMRLSGVGFGMGMEIVRASMRG